MHATSFLLLLTSYWVFSAFFSPVILSNIIEDQYMVEKAFNGLQTYDHAFDGMELPFLSHKKLSQFYLFTGRENVTLWYSITPCNNFIEEWYIKVNPYKGWKKYKANPFMKYTNKSRTQKDSKSQVRYEASAMAKQIAGFLDGDTGRNFKKRIIGQIENIPSSNLVVSLTTPPRTMVAVFASIRYSTKEPFFGYPRMKKDKMIQACVTKEMDLQITIPGFDSTEMEDVDYCAAINDQHPLPYRCSAHMFIDSSVIPAEEKVRRTLSDFQTTKLSKAQYKCSKERLIIFKNVDLKRTKYFINIYAINRRSDLSSSYPTITWDHGDFLYKKCERNAVDLPIQSAGNHKGHFRVVRLTTDLYIKLKGPAPVNKSFDSMWYVWFQPCKIPPKNSRYNVTLVSLTAPSHEERFSCSRTINRQPENVCFNQRISRYLPAPGSYKLTVENSRMQDVNTMVGYVILSHKNTYGNLFPFRGHTKGTVKSARNRLRLKYNCSNGTLSATIFTYPGQKYCFYLKEAEDRTKGVKLYKRSISRQLDLCNPNSAGGFYEQLCIENTSMNEKFTKTTVHFGEKLYNNTGYIVYVYYGIINRNDGSGKSIQTTPFYAYRYLSMTRENRKCERKRRKSTK